MKSDKFYYEVEGINEENKRLFHSIHKTLNEGVNRFVVGILAEIGDGDGENGGKGSLYNCLDEIRDMVNEHFINKETPFCYTYSGCDFFIAKIGGTQFEPLDILRDKNNQCWIVQYVNNEMKNITLLFVDGIQKKTISFSEVNDGYYYRYIGRSSGFINGKGIPYRTDTP